MNAQKKRAVGDFPQWVFWAAVCIAMLAARPFVNAATNQYDTMGQALGYLGVFGILVVVFVAWSATKDLISDITNLKQEVFERDQRIRELGVRVDQISEENFSLKSQQ